MRVVLQVTWCLCVFEVYGGRVRWYGVEGMVEGEREEGVGGVGGCRVGSSSFRSHNHDFDDRVIIMSSRVALELIYSSPGIIQRVSLPPNPTPIAKMLHSLPFTPNHNAHPASDKYSTQTLAETAPSPSHPCTPKPTHSCPHT